MKKIESAVKELQSKCDEIYGRFDVVMDLVNDIGLKNIKRTENIRLMLENERYFKTLSTSQIDRSFERGISRLEECHKQMTVNRFIPPYVETMWLIIWFALALVFASYFIIVTQKALYKEDYKRLESAGYFSKDVLEYMRQNPKDGEKLRRYLFEEKGWNISLE